MRAGVFSPRSVRRLAGDKPKSSRLSRRSPFFDNPPLFKGAAATFLEIAVIIQKQVAALYTLSVTYLLTSYLSGMDDMLNANRKARLHA